MILADITKIEALARFLGVEPHLLETILWGTLVAGLAFSLLHLLTMLVTKWGDSNATSKSLIFSLLVHLSCAFGLVAVSPPMPGPPADDPDETVLIQKVVLEAEEKVEIQDPGNTPIFNKPAETVDVKLTRSDWIPQEPKPIASPEREPEETKLVESDVPDSPSLPDEPEVTPKITHQGEIGPRKEAQVPLKIEETTAERRREVQIPASANSRTKLLRIGDAAKPVTRENSPRSINRINKDIKFSKRLDSVETQVSVNPLIKRAPIGNVIQRREGPVPTPIPAEETGISSTQPMRQTSGSSPAERRVTLRKTQAIDSRSIGSVERFRSEQSPQLQQPQIRREVSVRNALPSPSPRSGYKPNVLRRNASSVRKRTSTMLPETYRSRDPERQKNAIRKYGGTDETQRAVELSLKWLALHQHEEGFWDADRHGSGQVRIDEQGIDRQFAGKFSDTGVTSLALLAFLAKGYTHEEGRYSDRLELALRWLLRQQRADGFLGGEAVHHARMYCHAMATFALAEAYGMELEPIPDLELREPLQKAVDYILENQNETDGGWRYLKGQRSDVSMFGWQLMALNRAEIAGINVPNYAKARMVNFLKQNSRGEHGGLASYQSDYKITPVMTAESLFCKQVYRLKREDQAAVEAVNYLMQNLPKRSETNVYYWYYGTLAMFHAHGENWRQWNKAMQAVLLPGQRQEGDEAGSWDPIGPWGRYGGRVYSTALSALCLEVYFRDPPRYDTGEGLSTLPFNKNSDRE